MSGNSRDSTRGAPPYARLLGRHYFLPVTLNGHETDVKVVSSGRGARTGWPSEVGALLAHVTQLVLLAAPPTDVVLRAREVPLGGAVRGHPAS